MSKMSSRQDRDYHRDRVLQEIRGRHHGIQDRSRDRDRDRGGYRRDYYDRRDCYDGDRHDDRRGYRRDHYDPRDRYFDRRDRDFDRRDCYDRDRHDDGRGYDRADRYRRDHREQEEQRRRHDDVFAKIDARFERLESKQDKTDEDTNDLRRQFFKKQVRVTGPDLKRNVKDVDIATYVIQLIRECFGIDCPVDEFVAGHYVRGSSQILFEMIHRGPGSVLDRIVTTKNKPGSSRVFFTLNTTRKDLKLLARARKMVQLGKIDSAEIVPLSNKLQIAKGGKKYSCPNEKALEDNLNKLKSYRQVQ